MDIGSSVYLVTDHKTALAGVPAVIWALYARSARIAIEREEGTKILDVPLWDLLPARAYTATILRACYSTWEALDRQGRSPGTVHEDDLVRELARAGLAERTAEMCARLFAFGQQRAADRGLILVDTKYEVGRRPDGTLCLIDEIHTPDSSRYWYADDYQARFDRGEEPRGLDKEYVRRTLAEGGYLGDGPPPPLSDEVRCEAARRYIALYELVTGQEFVPDTAEPVARIKQKLGI